MCIYKIHKDSPTQSVLCTSFIGNRLFDWAQNFLNTFKFLFFFWGGADLLLIQVLFIDGEYIKNKQLKICDIFIVS